MFPPDMRTPFCHLFRLALFQKEPCWPLTGRKRVNYNEGFGSAFRRQPCPVTSIETSHGISVCSWQFVGGSPEDWYPWGQRVSICTPTMQSIVGGDRSMVEWQRCYPGNSKIHAWWFWCRALHGRYHECTYGACSSWNGPAHLGCQHNHPSNRTTGLSKWMFAPKPKVDQSPFRCLELFAGAYGGWKDALEVLSRSLVRSQTVGVEMDERAAIACTVSLCLLDRT